MFTPPGTSVLKALCGRVYSTLSNSSRPKKKYQLFPFTVNAGMEAGFLDSPYFWSESSTDSLKDFISQNDLAAVERESGWSLWIKKGPLSDSTHDFRQAASTVIPIARRAWGRMKYEGHRARLENPVTFIGHHKLVNYKASYERMAQLRAKNWKELEELARQHGYTSGCWVVTSPALEFWKDSWERLAESLMTGALGQTSAFMIRAYTRGPQYRGARSRYYILVHVPDIYDKAASEKVAQLLDHEGHCFPHPQGEHMGRGYALADILEEIGAKGFYGTRSSLNTEVWAYTAAEGLHRPE